MFWVEPKNFIKTAGTAEETVSPVWFQELTYNLDALSAILLHSCRLYLALLITEHDLI